MGSFVHVNQNLGRADRPFEGQVTYESIRRSSASPRPPCDGTPSTSVWPSPRQTPGDLSRLGQSIFKHSLDFLTNLHTVTESARRLTPSAIVRLGMGAYAAAARRRVYLATVLPWPPSSHRPDKARPTTHVSFRQDST